MPSDNRLTSTRARGKGNMVPVYQAKVPYGSADRRPWMVLPFPQAEYDRRIAAVRGRMRAEDLAALVAFSSNADPGHARYLANFEAGAGETFVVVPLDRGPMLATNWLMHGEPMHTSIWTTWFEDVRPAERPGFVRSPETSAAGQVADTLREAGADAERIGIAGTAILPHRVFDELRERLPRAEFVAADDLLLGVRARKSPLEIGMMRRAASLSGRMHEAAIAMIAPGVSERAVAARAHEAAFAVGFQAGDMVVLDMGAVCSGYCADVSRSLVVGRPSAEQRRFLDTGLAMFESVLAQARPGAAVRGLIEVARGVAERAGFGDDYMPKGFGHGVGCSLFEQPSLRPATEAILEPGHIFALEPMLIRMRFGTACVEETVLITPDGAEPLSGCPFRFW
ncbi:MAG: aminopeptidase P family protein [Bacillati bacterium ANGP1]|uniref:Aminopeptidase P family protein n=1 Tax=Candidatus Segetimicrobium genomatis TaxID=2569760 RepID=A0A537JMW7_9BACT|nr:MAG: aminopeptidase P family protein [Terrabacteria group bacterium ANGP1]